MFDEICSVLCCVGLLVKYLTESYGFGKREKRKKDERLVV